MYQGDGKKRENKRKKGCFLDETIIAILLLVLLIIASVTSICFYIYYTKYRELKNDRRKIVVLRDFEGNIKRIGSLASFGIKNKQFTIRAIPLEGDRTIQEWIINLKPRFTFDNVSRDYQGEDYRELTVFTDFHVTDFTRKIIEPCIDVSILELGLTRGIKAIEEKINPLYIQIETLEQAIDLREKEIRATQIENFEERLNFLKESKIAYKNLLDEMGAEITMAPRLLTAKIQSDRQSYAAGLKRFAEGNKQLTGSKTESAQSAEQPNKEQPTEERPIYPKKIKQNTE